MNNLVIKKIEPTEKERLKDLLDELKINFPKKVFIKPNIVASYKKDSGIITDVDLVEVLIKYLLKKQVEEIIVGESCPFGVNAEQVLKETGYKKLEKYLKVKVISLDNEERIILGAGNDKIRIPIIAKDYFYINFAKLKTHNQTMVSLGMKNQKGLLLGSDKARFHKTGLHESIARLSLTICPNLTIIDGIYALEGEGPVSLGKRKRADVVIAGSNVLEVDSLACLIMGIDPYKVEHIKTAEKIGVGFIDIKKLREKAKPYAKKFIFPKNKGYTKFLRMRFYFSDYTCSSCLNLNSRIFRFALKNPKYIFKIFYASV